MSREILDTVSGQLASLKSAITLIEDKIVDLEVALEQIDEYYYVGSNFKDEIQEEIDAAEARMTDYVDEEVNRLQSQIDDNGCEIEGVDSRVDDVESIAEDALSQSYTNENNIDELETKLNELDENVSDVVALVE